MFGIGATIGRIFGSDKALTSMVDHVSSGLDKLIYTNEEKAEDASKATTEARLMIVKWMDSTKGQNLARRLIALSIVSVWLFQFLSMNILSVAAVWADSPEKLIESAKVIGTFAKTLNSPIMLILAFYFSAPYMGDIAKGVLNKFGERK